MHSPSLVLKPIVYYEAHPEESGLIQVLKAFSLQGLGDVSAAPLPPSTALPWPLNLGLHH